MDDRQKIAETRAHIVRIGALMFEKRLTDSGGGNISVRVGDVVCFSPRYSGSHYLWNITPEQVVLVDLKGNKLEGNEEISREALVHLKLHNEFGEHGTAVIHGHSREILVFAALNRNMPPVLEQTRKFGDVPVVAYAPAHSADLAENVAASMRGKEAMIRKQAAGAIAAWHGVFVMGKDLNAAFDAVERMDTNAHILMMAQLFGVPNLMAEQRAELETAIQAYTPPEKAK